MVFFLLLHKNQVILFILASGFQLELLDINLMLQDTCAISDEAFLKFLNVNKNESYTYALKLVRNFALIIDNYR